MDGLRVKLLQMDRKCTIVDTTCRPDIESTLVSNGFTKNTKGVYVQSSDQVAIDLLKDGMIRMLTPNDMFRKYFMLVVGESTGDKAGSH